MLEHGRALNYDLQTRARRSIYDIPEKGFTWADLRDFVGYLDAGSALVAELHPELAGWQGDSKVPMLLAHIADTLSGLSYGYVLSHLKKGVQKPPAPEPIPRPGVESNKKGASTYGEGAIPISDFDAWWNNDNDNDESEA